jgi:hypothetical protein
MMVMPWERYQNTEEVSLKPWERYQDVSQLESGLRGAAQGLAMEWADEGIAKGRSVLTDVPYEQALQEERAKFKRAEEANPYTYRAGLVGGSVAPMFIPGGAVGTAIKNAPILTGIASGAISGYGANEVEGKGLEDAGYGALVGGGVGIGAKVLGNAISPKYWKETADSRALAQLGGGVAGIRRANPRNPAKAIDRALKVGERARTEGILSTDTQKMVSDFTKMSDESGETIGRILKDTDTQGLANIDVPSLGSQLDDVTSGVYQGMPYYENLKRVLSPKNKEFYTLEEAQAIKKRLGDLAGYSKGGGDTIEKSMARNAYDIINQSLEDAVERGQSTVGNKEQLYEYLAAKKRYGDAKIGSRMASTKAIRELGNKREFGLTDSIFAAQAASNPIVGAGMYGVKKGWEEYGNIGLSNFAGAMSKATSVNPLSLGKAAPMVQTSISRVGSALSQYPYEEMSKEDSIAHYIRSQRDPEYAQRIEDEKKMREGRQ